MTHRERILAAIRGDVPDRLPWLPRLEFWYRAKLRDGTLPPEFRGLTLMEITYRLGIAYYAILGCRPKGKRRFRARDLAPRLAAVRDRI
jgi:hypothetical protein